MLLNSKADVVLVIYALYVQTYALFGESRLKQSILDLKTAEGFGVSWLVVSGKQHDTNTCSVCDISHCSAEPVEAGDGHGIMATRRISLSPVPPLPLLPRSSNRGSPIIHSGTVWEASAPWHSSNLRSLSLLSVFLLHYIHRTCIYPLRLRKATKANTKTPRDFPVFVALLAFAFNSLNSYVQARWVSHYGDYERDQWFWWRFTGGFAVFVLGMMNNARSDLVLVGLKAQGGGYKIPRGGWFEVVSCPNYFWELVEWFSWAAMTWSWAGLGFFLYTFANLVPRACANHRWYLQKFGEDYPKGRKAVIPFLI
ncbi:Steroid 5-alpha-reductase DET2-like protein [Drosera capensis]